MRAKRSGELYKYTYTYICIYKFQWTTNKNKNKWIHSTFKITLNKCRKSCVQNVIIGKPTKKLQKSSKQYTVTSTSAVCLGIAIRWKTYTLAGLLVLGILIIPCINCGFHLNIYIYMCVYFKYIYIPIFIYRNTIRIAYINSRCFWNERTKCLQIFAAAVQTSVTLTSPCYGFKFVCNRTLRELMLGVYADC